MQAHPHGRLIAAAVVGSCAVQRDSPDSDLDLLLVVADDFGLEDAVRLGKALRLGLARCFPKQKLYLFDSPELDRPDLLPAGARRVQLLLHRIGWVRGEIKRKNWVFTCWAKKHLILLGVDPFIAGIAPVMNESLIDEFDGLPNILRRIDSASITFDLKEHADHFRKLIRYAHARVDDILDAFPGLASSARFRHGSPTSVWDELMLARTRVERMLARLKRALDK